MRQEIPAEVTNQLEHPIVVAQRLNDFIENNRKFEEIELNVPTPLSQLVFESLLKLQQKRGFLIIGSDYDYVQFICDPAMCGAKDICWEVGLASTNGRILYRF
jgi:hypothetical protein